MYSQGIGHLLTDSYQKEINVSEEALISTGNHILKNNLQVAWDSVMCAMNESKPKVGTPLEVVRMNPGNSSRNYSIRLAGLSIDNEGFPDHLNCSNKKLEQSPYSPLVARSLISIPMGRKEKTIEEKKKIKFKN